MLEIIILIALTKHIGAIVEAKGHKSGGYKVMTVLLWFGGEIVGAVVGAALRGPATSQVTVYVVALLGAAAGAAVAYVIADKALPVNPVS